MTCGPPWASEPTGAHLSEGTAGRRYVRIRSDVAAVPKLFDYAVPERWTETVTVGTPLAELLHEQRLVQVPASAVGPAGRTGGRWEGRLRRQLVDEVTREPVEGDDKGRGYEYEQWGRNLSTRAS